MLDILGVLGSAAGGGLVGLIGTAYKTRQERKDNHSRRQHELAMRKLDQEDMRLESELLLKQMEVEVEGQVRIADLEAQAARDVANAQTQTASYQSDTASYSSVDRLKGWWGNFWHGLLALVDVIRGLMRPAITLYLLVLCTLLARSLHNIADKANLLDAQQVWELYSSLTTGLIFLATTAVTWWFGSRPNKSPTK